MQLLDSESAWVNQQPSGTASSPSLSSSMSAHSPLELSPIPPFLETWGTPCLSLSLKNSSTDINSLLSPYSQLCNPFAANDLDEHLLSSYPQPLTSHPHLSNTLTPTELSLLHHYLTHTSLTIPIDEVDLYALQTGFPTLAFRSRVLMDSILALAAVCKAHDILTHARLISSSSPSTRTQERHHVLTLLAFADQHHKCSLSQTQTDLTLSISDNESYDYLLANAPLMVLYGSANHAARVLFVETASPAELCSLGPDFVPNQSQWINLVRAAHLAYAGMLNDTTETQSTGTKLSASKEGATSGGETEVTGAVMPDFLVARDFMLARVNGAGTLSDCGQQSPTGNRLFTSEDGPSKQTRQLFLPIVAATSSAALGKLRQRVGKGNVALKPPPWDPRLSSTDAQTTSICEHAELQTCRAALDILDDISAKIFRTPGRRNPSETEPPPFIAQSRLSRVSPWLRNYLARVTMATHTNPMRRTITAFINRVPGEYLRLLQPVLDLIPPATSGGLLVQLDGTRRLVLDIFAHWLVLAMLLDGVWWLGGIGGWELGRIVGCIGEAGLFGDERDQEGGEGTWWPASMYRIAKDLKSQVIGDV